MDLHGQPAASNPRNGTGHNLLELLDESDASLPALAPARPLPARTAATAALEAPESPSRAPRKSLLSGTGSKAGAGLTAGGFALIVVIATLRVGLRSEGVRNWISDRAASAGASQGTTGGSRVIELQRQIVDANEQVLSIMENVSDVASARGASPQFAASLQRINVLGEEAKRLGMQRMTDSQKQRLDELQRRDQDLVPRAEAAGLRLAALPGVIEALFADYFAQGGRLDAEPFGGSLSPRIPIPRAGLPPGNLSRPSPGVSARPKSLMPAITLSNAKDTPSGQVSVFTGGAMFTVDYRIDRPTGGGGWYYWVISGGGQRAEDQRMHMTLSGTLQGSISANPAQGPFQTWIEYADGPLSERTVVSNVAECQYVEVPKESRESNFPPGWEPKFPHPRF